MELKQMAKRKAEAQKIREEKAFMTDPPTRTAPYTVPKPFHLTPRTAGEGRAAAARAEYEQARDAECPFQPVTNEASIDSILRASTKGAVKAA